MGGTATATGSEGALTYDELYDGFRWDIPERFNIGTAVCDRWEAEDPGRLAIRALRADGTWVDHDFAGLRRLADRLASLLVAEGVRPGDRVAVLLPQVVETAACHIATAKVGAVAVPLFTLFGAEALEYRLGDSGAAVAVTDRQGTAKLAPLRDRLPALRAVFDIDPDPPPPARDLHAELAAHPDRFDGLDTRADDPALLIYTSGTTGPPKGALHAHRTLLGHLPGIHVQHDLFPQPGDRMWTPADWAWAGGLLDALLPALYHGVAVVARRFEKFTGEDAFALLADHGVRNAFIPPTALKLMRSVPDPAGRWSYRMRSIASGGEPLGAEVLEWGRATFGLTINEFYGQTECNIVISSSAALMPARPGWMGKAVPGHVVAVVDPATGEPVPDGEDATIAVRRPDPVMFLGYWANPEATAAKFVGDWMLTGDTGHRDADGWFRFVGRDDDVITSGGYRIGPGEIEDCLLGHPAVQLVGAVGKPDPVRTEIVKVYVVLRPGYEPSPELAAELAAHVRSRLAAHEYPREVEFLDELPLTTTGKIIRRELRERARREARGERP
jgi:acetyl-CoA synthetase